MRNKKIIFLSLTLCLIIGLSACGKKPAEEAVNNKVTTSAPDSKIDTIKQEVKKAEPVEAPKKEESKKEEVKKETPKQTSASTNKTTTNTSKPAEQPKQVTAPATTTTTPTQPTTPAQPSVPSQDIPEFQEFHTLMQNAVPNNGKYKVTFDKTQGSAPNLINYTIVTAENNNGVFFNKRRNYVVYNNNVIATDNWVLTSRKDSSGNNILETKMGIPKYDNMPNALDCYVIIVGNDNITYYEKMTYTITK